MDVLIPVVIVGFLLLVAWGGISNVVGGFKDGRDRADAFRRSESAQRPDNRARGSERSGDVSADPERLISAPPPSADSAGADISAAPQQAPRPPGVDISPSTHIEFPRRARELTELLHEGLYLRTSMTEDAFWSVAEGVARWFPVQKDIFTKLFLRVWTVEQSNRRVFGLGWLDSKGLLSGIRWSFGVRPVRGGLHITHDVLSIVGSEVNNARELRLVLNTLMDAVCRVDPDATIQFL